MSVLSLPRLHFSGLVWWNPGTGNSFDPGVYDRATATVRLPVGVPKNELHRYLTELDGPKLRCGFNFYGDYRCGFLPGTRIEGGVFSDGTAVLASDAVTGAELTLLGHGTECKIVDVDPYGGWSSQLFLDGFRIGASPQPILVARGAAPMMFQHFDHERNCNVSADLPFAGRSGVLWQTAVPADQVTIDATRSPALQALQEQWVKGSARGLMLRFYVYRTEYFQNGAFPPPVPRHPSPRNLRQLGELYRDGGRFANPTVGRVVGAIGPWFGDEPATVPAGRLLRPASRVVPRTWPLRDRPPSLQLGPIRAELHGDRLALDLSCAFPELDSTGNKVDFGSVRVCVIEDGTVTEVGALTPDRYGRVAFERGGGIAEINLLPADAASVQRGTLRTFVQQPDPQDPTGTVWVVAHDEEELVGESAVRSVYLDEGETVTLEIQVRERGSPAPDGTCVLVAQYQSEHPGWTWRYLPPQPVPPSPPPPSAVEGADLRDSASLDRARASAGPQPDPPTSGPHVTLVEGESVCMKGGRAQVSLKARRPGCFNLLLLPYRAGDPPPPVNHAIPIPDLLGVLKLGHFVSGRVLPFDNRLDDVKQVTWDVVRSEVLDVYLDLFPFVASPGHPVDLSNEEVMRQFCQRIIDLTDPSLRSNSRYMPVTRDLSAGKRNLLRRWCEDALAGGSTDGDSEALLARSPLAGAALHAEPVQYPENDAREDGQSHGPE
jgi:hypothetical protein